MADRYYIVKEDNNDGCGGLLIAGAVLFIVALPVFLLWLLLFGESKKRYNWLKHSLSKYTRVVLLLWALIGYFTFITYKFQLYEGTSMSAEDLQAMKFIEHYGVSLYSAVALVMIILGALLYRKFGRNPWSGTADSQLRSKSVTRAIGWSVLIFLIAWIVLGLLGMALGYWWLTFVIAGASYFVIENFL